MWVRASLAASVFAALLCLSAAARAAAEGPRFVDLRSDGPSAEAIIAAVAGTAAGERGGVRESVLVLDLPFAAGSARLAEEARATVDALAKAMQAPELAGFHFILAGHTDASGSRIANIALSEDRARAVHERLVEAGVGSELVLAVGYGPDRPLEGEAPDSAKNRRVEVHALPPQIATVAIGSLPVQLDFSVNRMTQEGDWETVDPAETVFKTGERIHLLFKSNLTGLFEAFNINPQGEVSKLGEWSVATPSPARLPSETESMEFTGAPGKELLVLQFHPCTVGERDMRISAEVQAALPACEGLNGTGFQDDRTRDLPIRANPEGGTAATVLPVGAAGGETVQIAIPLTHD